MAAASTPYVLTPARAAAQEKLRDNRAWPDEKVERLKELWAAGDSTRAIGRQLGVSGSAVIGKVQRLGLTPRTDLERVLNRRVAGGPVEARPPKVRPPRAKAFNPLPGFATVALIDLQHHHCRWPINVNGGVEFCGRKKAVGSYCLSHAKISEGEGTATERNAVAQARKIAA